LLWALRFCGPREKKLRRKTTARHD
jgi:hypothetical protein